MRVTANFSFAKNELNQFQARCDAAIRNVGRGTKKATEQACKDILAESLMQVPKQTDTLASSAYYQVSRRTDTSAKTYAYEAIIGYGGNGDPINPRTGSPASQYMVAVHEDLHAYHVNGKAKFLEDPVREYGKENFSRTFFQAIREALADFIK